jgi:hypothetical protein
MGIRGDLGSLPITGRTALLSRARAVPAERLRARGGSGKKGSGNSKVYLTRGRGTSEICGGEELW